jgi:hypothetical protein
MHPIDAAVELGRRHGLTPVDPVVLKDGSNLIIHLAPAPVVVRVATFTGWIRGDPEPYLAREVALTRALASVAPVAAPASDAVPPGPHEVAGWWMSVTAWVEHQPGVVPAARATLAALDVLHDALGATAVDLPFLGPVCADLDLAWDRLEREGILDPAAIRGRRQRRTELVGALSVAASERRPLHGDAFPRNSLLAPDGRVVWIDFEDACAGPAAWDHAVLIRQGGDPTLEPELRARDGNAAIDVALALRELQIEAWMLLHDARAAGRLAVPRSFSSRASG